MAGDFNKSRWPEIRELIRLNWDQIEEEEIDSLRGRLDLLSAKLQQVYAYSKERADREMLEFKQGLKSNKSTSVYVPNKNILY